MTAPMLPAELRGEDLAGKAPAGAPPDPAGATNWPVWCLFAEFAQAVGVQLPADRRGGKRGDPNGEAPRLVVGPVSPDSP